MTTQKEPSPSASKRVLRNTRLGEAEEGSSYRVSVCFRLPVDVLEAFKRVVPNVSGKLRELVYDFLQSDPSVEELEMVQLRIDVQRLVEELEQVHGYQKLLLKHGSYAEAYWQKVRGGVVNDRKPFNLREPPVEIKPEELKTVKQVIDYREKLAEELNAKLKRLIELKQQQRGLGEATA